MKWFIGSNEGQLDHLPQGSRKINTVLPLYCDLFEIRGNASFNT